MTFQGGQNDPQKHPNGMKIHFRFILLSKWAKNRTKGRQKQTSKFRLIFWLIFLRIWFHDGTHICCLSATLVYKSERRFMCTHTADLSKSSFFQTICIIELPFVSSFKNSRQKRWTYAGAVLGQNLICYIWAVLGGSVRSEYFTSEQCSGFTAFLF